MSLDPTTGLLLLMALDILLAIVCLISVERLHRKRKPAPLAPMGSISIIPHPEHFERGTTVDGASYKADRWANWPHSDTHTGDTSMPEEIRRRLNGGDAA